AVPGHVRSNLAVGGIGQDGAIRIRNDQGTTQVAVNLVGWFAPDSGARYVSLPQPVKVLDTRRGTGAPAGPIGQGGVDIVQIGDVGGIPHNATAPVLAATGGGDGYTLLSVGPTERGWSGLADVDGIEVGGMVSGAVVPRLGPSGRLRLRN